MSIDQEWSKGKKLVRMTFPLYFLIELIVDEALYDFVWYGPLFVEVFTLLPIYVCDVNMALKAIILWMCFGDESPYVKLMPSFSYCTYDLRSMANVMRM